MKNFILLGISFLLPAVASAGEFVNDGNLGAIRDDILQVVNDFIIPLLFALAFVIFLWGVFNFLILGAGDKTKRSEGLQFILWGIIGFFVMVSVWGIVNLITGAFGFGGQNIQQVPEVNL